MFTMEKLKLKNTPEKYQEYAEEIVPSVVDLLRRICFLEEQMMKDSEQMEKKKEQLGIPKWQVALGAKERLKQYHEDYEKLIQERCTEDLIKRGFAGSYGKPAKYAYLNTGCEVYFTMKSPKKAIIETQFPHGVTMKHQFTVKLTDDGWKLNDVKYGFGGETNWYKDRI